MWVKLMLYDVKLNEQFGKVINKDFVTPVQVNKCLKVN